MPQVDISTQKTTAADIHSWNKQVTHPLQSWQWGEFRQAMGIDVERIAWRSPELAEGSRPELAEGSRPELVEGQLTFHRIPHTPWCVGYFPKGPPPTKSMIKELHILGQRKNAICIQLEPNVIENDKLKIKNYDLRPSHHPLFTKYTFVLDLTKSEEELLKAMHSKTRYNLRVAQKHNVTVTEDNSDSAFEEYLRLNRETTDRQGFYAHNTTYHQTMWQIMHAAGIAHLFVARYQEKILAAWIIFAFGTTLYYPYGTSSRESREVMAPTLLLWEIARWGKSHGYRSFDLWGALGPSSTGEPDPNDPWYGFHRFKQGFNPVLTEYAGSFDLVIHPVLYKLYTVADTIRWMILKRKAGGS